MINRFHGIGNMTADPDYSRGDNESSDRCEFSIAINKPGRGDDRPEPTYLDIVTWGKEAGRVSEWGRKGRMVYVEGEIEVRKWQDKDSGKERRAFRIKAYVTRFLDKPDRDDDRGRDRGRDDRDRDRDRGRDRDDDRRGSRRDDDRGRRDDSRTYKDDLPFD